MVLRSSWFQGACEVVWLAHMVLSVLYWAIEALGGADLTSPAGVGETLRKSYVTLLFAKCAGKALSWHKLMRTSRTLLSLASLGRQKIDLVVSGQLQDAWDVIQVVQGIEQRLQLARR